MLNKKNAFNNKWTPVDCPPTIVDGYYQMREWQQECYDELKDSHHWIINAPMGSGKSFMICCLDYKKLENNPNLRAIIAVPQTIIAEGFRKNKIQFSDTEKVDWFPQHDLCKEASNQTTDELLGFLKGPNSKSMVQDRILVCSHQTLVYAFKKNKKLFKDVIIVVDEAHHVKHNVVEDVEVSNGIGSVVKYSFDNPKNNIQVELTTATFFRGDKNSIIPEEYKAQFDRFNYPFDKYLKTCKYLRSYSYDFILYNQNYKESIKELFDEEVGKTIVYVPSVNGSYSLETKYIDVEEIIKGIAGTDKPVIKDKDKPIMLVKRDKEWIKVIDLVTETNRESKKQAIIDAHDAKTSESVDVIITLNMFKEGANWRWADREIIIGPRNSLSDLIQTMGRLFRDAEGKSHVSVYQLLPYALDQVNNEKFCDNLNDYMKAIFLTMIMEDVFKPVRIKVPAEKKKGKAKEKEEEFDYFANALPDENDRTAVYSSVYDDCMRIISDDGEISEKKFEEIVSRVLKNRGVEDNHKAIAEQIRRRFIRKSLSLEGIDVSDIDYSIMEAKLFGFVQYYTSGESDVKTFKGLREAYQKSIDENKEEILKIAKSGGNKPSQKTKLGRALRSYIYFSSSYDFKFRTELKKIRPDWFITHYDIARDNKKEILNIARTGGDKLSRKTKLGQCLKNYINPTSSYDLEFKKELEKIRPDWFITPQDIVKENKEKLLNIARLGLEKPKYEIDIGSCLCRYTNSNNSCYDTEFKAKIEKIRPDWFQDTVKDNKEEILKIARSRGGKPSRKTKLGSCLSSYVAYSSSSYDTEFREELERIRPDWFIKKDNSEENKKKLLNIARSGGAKPPKKTKLGMRLRSYIGTSHGCYDTEFREELKEIRLDWFEKIIICSIEETKEYIKPFNFKIQKEYREWSKSGKRPNHIPGDPYGYYKNKGWTSWSDFLGTGKRGKGRNFLSFEEARKYVRKLGLKSKIEYIEWYKKEKPINLPVRPDSAYKNKGWIDWYDFLGKEK